MFRHLVCEMWLQGENRGSHCLRALLEASGWPFRKMLNSVDLLICLSLPDPFILSDRLSSFFVLFSKSWVGLLAMGCPSKCVTMLRCTMGERVSSGWVAVREVVRMDWLLKGLCQLVLNSGPEMSGLHFTLVFVCCKPPGD